ncbi:hypothetical protein D9758_007010 [Tetrapyrgos nigripes]|uniref:DUF6534 domain-containing protein n=1 Tax=Tetrapyrgos nigripes TaxID=182062 RepID=A0A8H5GSL5_9AGAR|nr:hypothetical protein D9758_007010 [Tetrapyrgos nigripes]
MSQPEPGPPGGPPGVSINIAPDFDGPFFGYSLSLILFGIIVSQGWIYIHNNKDNWMLRTDTLLQKMLRFTISRGLLVTIFQIVVLILYLVKPNNLWWIGCYFNLTKVYIITTLAMLNYRSSLHNNVGPVVISDMTFRAKRTQNSTPLYQLEDTCSFQVADEAHNTVEGQKTVSNA